MRALFSKKFSKKFEKLVKSYLDRRPHRHRPRQPRVQDRTSLCPLIHQILIRQSPPLQICLRLRSLRRCLLHFQILNLKKFKDWKL